MIHTFGDSHCLFGWSSINGAIPHHINGITCYSFGKNGLEKLDIKKEEYKVRNGDTVIFCLGELDCRFFIKKYIDKSNSYKQIIDSIVKNYFIKIKESIEGFSKLRVCVYNIPPPFSIDKCIEPLYPFNGTDDERKSYVVYFNKKLKEYCDIYGYTFINIYKKYTDREGFLNDEFSDGSIHIKDSTYINLFLKSIHLFK